MEMKKHLFLSSKNKNPYNIRVYLKLEQMTGIEPASSPWQGDILPLNHICSQYDIYYIMYDLKHK